MGRIAPLCLNVDLELTSQQIPARILLVAILERAIRDLISLSRLERINAINWFECAPIEATHKDCRFTFIEIVEALELSAKQKQCVNNKVNEAKSVNVGWDSMYVFDKGHRWGHRRRNWV